MPGAVSFSKDCAKVRARRPDPRGHGALRQRVVRLDELTIEQRRLVMALVEAAKAAPGRRPEAGHPHAEPVLGVVAHGQRPSDA